MAGRSWYCWCSGRESSEIRRLAANINQCHALETHLSEDTPLRPCPRFPVSGGTVIKSSLNVGTDVCHKTTEASEVSVHPHQENTTRRPYLSSSCAYSLAASSAC